MDLTPKAVVRELDRYIIGQADAKRSVAIALRNRYRRSLLDEKLRRITPKNIIMIGPTGVGKRNCPSSCKLAVLLLSKLSHQITEVGYVGRCESIIRDLVESSIVW